MEKSEGREMLKIGNADGPEMPDGLDRIQWRPQLVLSGDVGIVWVIELSVVDVGDVSHQRLNDKSYPLSVT